MSFIGIRIPLETARLLHEINVPGTKCDTAHLHITLLYLGKDIPIKILSKTMSATYEVIQNISPFRVKVSNVDCFEPSAENKPVPVIAPVQSIKIHELNNSLKKMFNKKRINYDKTYKEYKPHITLSLNDETIIKTKIEPIEWSVQEIVLWGGNSGDNKIAVNFPIELKKNEEIMDLCCGK